ncbi:hypothetical protein GBP346_A1984 [Burkholderia pseudomallei MSHR346]|nr:hypothetical protein GBP346_A1984 [Burkholderia pseudomallei MSHR346]
MSARGVTPRETRADEAAPHASGLRFAKWCAVEYRRASLARCSTRGRLARRRAPRMASAANRGSHAARRVSRVMRRLSDAAAYLRRPNGCR